MRILPLAFPIAAMMASPAAAATPWSTSRDGMKCVAIRHADRVRLWVFNGEHQVAVEGSEESATERGDNDASHLLFEVALRADRPSARCMRLRWRAEPWGPHPVNAMDFGGKFPEGTVDLIYDAEHDETSGAIQLWAPDDHLREEPETFRVVLLDPATRKPLAGTIGVYDPETGMRSHHPSPESLAMRDRLVMTVEDAPEQAARH